MAAANKLIQQVVFSGIQPTGFIHLGNYLGAVKNWVHLQETVQDASSLQRYFCIVDYHSITQRYVGQHIHDTPAEGSTVQTNVEQRSETPEELTLKTAATLLACGIDPGKSTLFVQSHVGAHTEMMWFLSTMTPLSWLNKMIQFKEKKASSDNHSSLSLYSYPVLMAADILLYKASLVPVGHDQTQHLELARDIGARYNRMFGDLFPEPKDYGHLSDSNACQRVMSLQDAKRKMSKSDVSRLACINLVDSAETIRAKVRKAKTDNLGQITYEPELRPEVANLLRIYSAVAQIDVHKSPQMFEGDNMFAFKQKLSDLLVDKVCPIGERALEISEKEEDRLLEILHQGARAAETTAQTTLAKLKEQVGILRRNL